MTEGVDPLDAVLAEYSSEQQAAAALQAEIRRHADIMVNSWRNGMIPLVQECSKKIAGYNIKLGGPQSTFGPHAGAGSKLMLAVIGMKNFEPTEMAKLTLTLKETGAVEISMTGADKKEEYWGELWDKQPFPEVKFKQLIAQLVAVGLRKR